MITITFAASIRITEDDLLRAEGDAAQAVQNVIGHTGASVITITSSSRRLA